MKKIAVILSIFVFLTYSLPSYGIGSYAVKDTLHVLTLAGLKLRTSPKLQSGVKTVLPYGSFVIVKQLTTAHDSITEIDGYGIRGSWVEIESDFGEGFVFDGYLSHYLPPKITEKDITGNTMESYIQELYTPLSKKMPASKHPKEFNQAFSHGIRFSKRIAPDSTDYGRIIIQDISLEEAYLIANVICRTEQEGGKPNYLAEKAVEVKVEGNEIMISPSSGAGLAVRILKEEKKGGGGGAMIQYRYVKPKVEGEKER